MSASAAVEVSCVNAVSRSAPRHALSDERFGYTHFCVAYPITDIDLDV